VSKESDLVVSKGDFIMKNRIRKMSKKSRDSVQKPNLPPKSRKKKTRKAVKKVDDNNDTTKKMMMKLAKLNISAHEGRTDYLVLSVP